MQERLICPTTVELVGSKQLLTSNYPLAQISDIEDPEQFICDFDIDVSKPTFFRWAVLTTSEAGISIVTYCYSLSLDLCDPPPWMRGVLADLKIPLRMLSEGDNLSLF